MDIDRERGINEIFAMPKKFESETESDTENLLEDSDKKYIAEEPIPDNEEESRQLLTPEATVHVESEILDINKPPAKKVENKVAELKWKRLSTFVKAKKCTLEENVLLDIPENANPLLIFEGIRNFNELVKHLRPNKSICDTKQERCCYKF